MFAQTIFLLQHQNKTMKNRNKEIDFLRGIAILMVVFYHLKSVYFLNKVGWMGVDLFFVLSGYLVSGLLFKEYLKYKAIDGKKFLIRRGFKIYPVFYVFLIIAAILKILFHQNITAPKVLFEALFIKNYLGGIWSHTWSLCVEEHFYFLITFGFYFLAKNKMLHHARLMHFIFFGIMIFCLLNRLLFIQIPLYKRLPILFYAQTHFRIDSMIFGVMIAWHKYFNPDNFSFFFNKWKAIILPVAILILLPSFIFTTSLDEPSYYMRTFGYTGLYLGFGLILIFFVIDEKIVTHLNKILSRPLVNIISVTGIYSYSIYLFHPLIKNYVAEFIPWDYRIVFIIYLLLSCLVGAFFSKFIEYYFLKIRDKYYPSRSGTINPSVENLPQKTVGLST